MSEVGVQVEGKVAVLTIDRPHARNAIGLATMAELGEALDQIENEPVNVLVVRGAGDRAFVSGGDLKELSAIRDEQGAIDMATRMRRLLDRLATFPVPVVAALNGHALGGGAEVAVAADIRIAADDVSIGFTQVQLAIMPAWGGAERLAELVGRSRAMLLIAAGTRLSAAEAERIGLRADRGPAPRVRRRLARAGRRLRPAARGRRQGHQGRDLRRQAARPSRPGGRRRAALRPPLGRRRALARGRSPHPGLPQLMPARILVAKPGLDGHDRGAKLVARALRDAGYEVIYTGIRQRPEQVAAVAAQEDVQIVGLSILSGSHLALTRKTVAALESAGATEVRVVVGGTIPSADVEKLIEAGASAVFPTGTPLDKLLEGIRALTEDDAPHGG